MTLSKHLEGLDCNFKKSTKLSIRIERPLRRKYNKKSLIAWFVLLICIIYEWFNIRIDLFVFVLIGEWCNKRLWFTSCIHHNVKNFIIYFIYHR